MDTKTLKRLDEIRRALHKYGFDKILGQTTRSKLNPLSDSDASQILLDTELPVKLRLLFQELGTTFIKLGQLLSTRPDIVGEKISKELSKLQDDNPAISYEEVKSIIESELEGSIDDLFASFSKEHLATASIGQVHEAKLKSGERVAVKVQKSGITSKIDLDLVIMKFIAVEADRFNSKIRKLNLPGIMEEFDRSIHKEIDYTNELMNMKHIENNFRLRPNIHIPVSYEEYSTEKVLTMEFIDGEKLSNLYKDNDSGFDKKVIAKRLVDSYLNQIFIDGFFHGDPHPGNILILPGDVVCYIDLGMMGLLDEDFKRNLCQLMVLFSDRDINGLITQLIYMDILDSKVDTKRLKRDLNDLFSRYFGVELKRFNGVIEDLLALMQKYDVILPNEFVTMARGLSIVEDVAQHLDGDFDVFTFLKPLSVKILAKSLNPRKLFKEKKNNLFLYEHMIKSLPRVLSNTVRKIEEGELKFKFEVDRLDEITNKISLALIISALLIGSSIVITIDKGPMLFDMPLIAVVGFVISFVLGFISVWKYVIRK